ncbi:hypothetical protein L1987_52198 [Smallanthus sonchifolius]|uniref:Uncharacterized protein n=1 Tax=Smallanthus sonchifolius TaxID=185202 RepID=A0ACB9ESS7_9ASTR|nr:hypothetical protein L1987_52198 [Smallanthus sonchifolius]
MGKKGWFYAMKKAVSPSFSKIKRGKRSHKSKSNPKNSWHGNQMNLDTCSSPKEAALASPFHPYHPINETEFKLPENEQIKHVDSITYTTTIVEDTTYPAPAEVTFTTSNSCFVGKTREEISAVKIQTAYRGYKARRGFRSLRAMWRLNLWIQGQAVKRQTATTIARIQTMGRVQSQVRARRTRMAQVNETLQRQQAQKREKTKKEAFNLSPKSKEQVEAMLKSKREAAERREKALAYAFSRQQAWRNSQKPACQAVVDPNHLEWQWSWSNRWDAIRPWETGTTSNKECVGDMVRRQSPPSSPPSKALSPKSQISKPGPRSLGSPVGLAKKRCLVTNSPSSVGKRSSIAVR